MEDLRERLHEVKQLADGWYDTVDYQGNPVTCGRQLTSASQQIAEQLITALEALPREKYQMFLGADIDGGVTLEVEAASSPNYVIIDVTNCGEIVAVILNPDHSDFLFGSDNTSIPELIQAIQTWLPWRSICLQINTAGSKKLIKTANEKTPIIKVAK